MTPREELFVAGVGLMKAFCLLNSIPEPKLVRLRRTERLYHLASCAFYRPTTITIMVEKCANKGHGGRAWSWPGYAIDRTPYGVIQHELGHHVDEVRSTKPLKQKADLFSYCIYQLSREAPLTGYLGTDTAPQTFFQEWFAEHFRLFVTNPELSRAIAPKFFVAMLQAGLKPLHADPWGVVLRRFAANDRILDQAAKKTGWVGQF